MQPRTTLINIINSVNSIIIIILYPLNLLLTVIYKNRFQKGSVLHISYTVHIPYYTVQLLRKKGVKADYLALGKSKVWNKYDYNIRYQILPIITAFNEFIKLWKIAAKYEIIHCHFERSIAYNGWDLYFLKKLGRKIVIHHRGCHSRDRDKNNDLINNSDTNICSECDYNPPSCLNKIVLTRRKKANKYGDLFLLTTPDLKDFVPNGVHYPFYTPEISDKQYNDFQKNYDNNKDYIKIVHATNHPGIEGSKKINTVINNLKKKGYNIQYTFLQGVTHDTVLAEMQTADLTIGKMKMGYYANAQIESMCLGVPAVTYIRPEFMTKELKNSGLIICSLKNLEETLEYYLKNQDKIKEKRQKARSSILQLHNNDVLIQKLIDFYKDLNKI